MRAERQKQRQDRVLQYWKRYFGSSINLDFSHFGAVRYPPNEMNSTSTVMPKSQNGTANINAETIKNENKLASQNFTETSSKNENLRPTSEEIQLIIDKAYVLDPAKSNNISQAEKPTNSNGSIIAKIEVPEEEQVPPLKSILKKTDHSLIDQINDSITQTELRRIISEELKKILSDLQVSTLMNLSQLVDKENFNANKTATEESAIPNIVKNNSEMELTDSKQQTHMKSSSDLNESNIFNINSKTANMLSSDVERDTQESGASIAARESSSFFRPSKNRDLSTISAEVVPGTLDFYAQVKQHSLSTATDGSSEFISSAPDDEYSRAQNISPSNLTKSISSQQNVSPPAKEPDVANKSSSLLKSNGLSKEVDESAKEASIIWPNMSNLSSSIIPKEDTSSILESATEVNSSSSIIEQPSVSQSHGKLTMSYRSIGISPVGSITSLKSYTSEDKQAFERRIDVKESGDENEDTVIEEDEEKQNT